MAVPVPVPALSVLMVLCAVPGLAHGITLGTDYACARLDSKVSFPVSLKKEPTFLEWSFRKSPRSTPSVMCIWYLPDQRECRGSYTNRARIYINGTLLLGSIRAADSGWYYLHAKFSQDRSIHHKVQLYIFGQVCATALVNDYRCSRVNVNTTLSVHLKQAPTVLQWTFRKLPKSQPSVICTWNPNDKQECHGIYKQRAHIYNNGTLVLESVRAADAGYYCLHAEFSKGKSIFFSMQLYVFASSSRTVRSPLPLLLGLMLLKCSL